MTNPVAKSRPEFRNIHVSQLLHYKLPPPGLVSIMHRISGAALFLLLPFILWLFELSLTSEISYARLVEVASNALVKLVLVGLAWAYLHHLIAGVRYLMLDLHIGLDKPVARTSALAVYWISLPLTLIAALKIFGVF
ncbi:MAG TPA: succinate dehydrogenase, cytochrome b556 subunit [Burkholderiaceae bacterium]|nr:succinate dehydrogenase, cytochrome b556 subunit [Burkholderiaceae bacterium]